MPSGRFLLRLPASLHAALSAQAAAAGLSLNAWCVLRLGLPVGAGASEPGALDVLVRAAEVAGSSLLGLVVYGSWARGEARDGSDVDVAVVVADELPLTRALYRAWDERPITWSGRPVEPHFVHAPRSGPFPGGLWAELALDGLVLHERGFEISAHLRQLRHELATGRVVRRVAHGQPYWSTAA